ncbi:MAG: heavy metal translocating P-type ATPase [Candidatus Methanomethylophilaceae archaeon]
MNNRSFRVLISFLLFVPGILLDRFGHGSASLAVLLIAYLIVGYSVIIDAARSLRYGMMLDENFLTVIASSGAFLIGAGVEGVAVMLFFSVGMLFEEAAVRESRRSISELVEMQPVFVRVVRNGSETEVPPEDVKVGELFSVLPGERIPIDGTVVSGTSSLDLKALTGESLPKNVNIDDAVLSGGINLTGSLTLRAEKVYSESTVARVLELVEESGAMKSESEKFITVFARYYTPAVVVAAITVALVPVVFFGLPADVWVYRALVMLVISCPCALVISVPLTFFCGVGRASKNGILINGGAVMDRLTFIDSVVMDKTGTVTKGSFDITGVYPENVSSNELIMYAAMSEYRSDHPISRAILNHYGKEINASAIGESENIPGKGVMTAVDGKTVHTGNAGLMKDVGIDSFVDDGDVTNIHVAVDGVYFGRITISDTPKEDSGLAVRELEKLGVKETVMLTGDTEASAGRIADLVGIREFHSELLPEEKLRKLEEYLERGRKTLVYVGDGINDAPSIARADVGIAMGGIGSDSAVEAADVVIMNDSLCKIPEAVRISRDTRKIAYQNIVFSLAVKFLALGLAVSGLAGMWFAIFADVGVSVIAILNGVRAYGFEGIGVGSAECPVCQ